MQYKRYTSLLIGEWKWGLNTRFQLKTKNIVCVLAVYLHDNSILGIYLNIFIHICFILKYI